MLFYYPFKRKQRKTNGYLNRESPFCPASFEKAMAIVAGKPKTASRVGEQILKT
jgi:hypothetical protein